MQVMENVIEVKQIVYEAVLKQDIDNYPNTLYANTRMLGIAINEAHNPVLLTVLQELANEINMLARRVEALEPKPEYTPYIPVCADCGFEIVGAYDLYDGFPHHKDKGDCISALREKFLKYQDRIAFLEAIAGIHE
jgi:hypothetical protein